MFLHSVGVCSTYWPVFSVARTCCASRTFSTESGVFARFPCFGVWSMFLQRIGQFLAPRARAALVGRFPRNRAFLPGFHVFGVRSMFLQRIGQFSASRRTCYASRTFSTDSGVFARFPRFWRSVHVSATYWPVF